MQKFYSFATKLTIKASKFFLNRYISLLLGNYQTQVWEIPYSRPDVACNFLNILKEVPKVAVPKVYLLFRENHSIIIITCHEEALLPRFHRVFATITGVTHDYTHTAKTYLNLAVCGGFDSIVNDPTPEDVMRLCPQKEKTNADE